MHHSGRKKPPGMSNIEVRPSMFEPDYDVVAQAIFWRPLRNFTMYIREREDELDLFDAVSLINRKRDQLRSACLPGSPETYGHALSAG